jgi:trehalose-6-phosphate synthase
LQTLIFRKFTGTYGTFGACLRVNPWDYSQVSVAIHEALSMGEEEKDERWQSLYQNVATNTAQYWAGSFISELEKVRVEAIMACNVALDLPSGSRPTPIQLDVIRPKYRC